MATMKSWHIVVMDGYKVVEDREKFDVKESKVLFEELKEKYKESNPTYKVTRDWY